MIDYFLKFADEAEADSVLDVIDASTNIDIIGAITRDEVTIDGWHVNIRASEPIPELEKYSVVPKQPFRVWA